MKHFLYSMLFVAATAAAVPQPSYASPLKGTSTTSFTGNDLDAMEPGAVIKSAERFNSRLLAPKKADSNEETAKVTVKLTFDSKTVYPSTLTFYSDDGEQYTEYLSAAMQACVVDLKKGHTYQISGVFYRLNEKKKPAGVLLNIIEDYKVDGDSETQMDCSTSTNKIRLNSLLPNGEKAVLSTVRYTSAKEYEVISEGNVPYITTMIEVFHKKCGVIAWTNVAAKTNIEGNEYKPASDIDDFQELWVNNLSDNCLVSFSSNITDNNKTLIYNIDYYKKGSASETLENNPADYIDVHPDFTPSNEGKTCQYTATSPYSFTISHYWADLPMFGSAYIGQDLKYCPTPSKYRVADFSTGIHFDYSDYILEEWESGGVLWQSSSPTVAPDIVIYSDGKQTQMNAPLEKFYTVGGYPSDVEGFTHPLLASVPEQRVLPYGASPAFVSFVTDAPKNEEGGRDMNVYPCHFGYTGEVVNTYYWTSSFTGVYNDTEELPIADYSGLGDCIYDWNTLNKADGKYTFTFATNEAHVFDGLKASTNGTVSYDLSKEDYVTPVVQYLQFRTKTDDKITHILPTPQEGKMILVAGDFTYDENEKGGYVHTPGVTPRISYSAYAKGDWKELSATKQETTTDGRFAEAYVADLDQLNEESTKGWFDLKIEMTDTSGNSSSQTISPAFCIESLAGAESILATKSGIRVHTSGKNLIVTGAENPVVEIISAGGAKVAKANSSAMSLRGLGAGVYIVSVTDGANSTVSKIVVR